MKNKNNNDGGDQNKTDFKYYTIIQWWTAQHNAV